MKDFCICGFSLLFLIGLKANIRYSHPMYQSEFKGNTLFYRSVIFYKCLESFLWNLDPVEE